MQGHIYHWRHGWIPLTHYAALVKAHGSHKGAAKYLNESNGHHGSESHKLGEAAHGHHAPETHGGFAKGAHVAYNGRVSDGTGTVEGSRKLDGETILQVRDHKDGKVYEWAPEHVKEVSKAAAPTKAKAAEVTPRVSQQNAENARMWAAKAKQLDAEAAAKRAEAERASNSVGWNDRAAGRLDARGMKQFHRGHDAALRKYTEAMREAKALESKAHLARARAEEAARARLTHDDIKGATHIQDSVGWHEVVRVNAKSVTVKTEHSWTKTIPHDKIIKVHGTAAEKTHSVAGATEQVDTHWQKLTNGNQIRQTNEGLIVTDGDRTVHIRATSVSAMAEARRLAARDVRNLLDVARKKSGDKWSGTITLNADGSYTGPKAWALR